MDKIQTKPAVYYLRQQGFQLLLCPAFSRPEQGGCHVVQNADPWVHHPAAGSTPFAACIDFQAQP
jgi:hypothetical protein